MVNFVAKVLKMPKPCKSMECRPIAVMSDFPNIIDSKIISSEYDSLWGEVNLPEPLNKDAGTLVVCAPFTIGSAEDAQLAKMMQACKLNVTDYNILQAAPEKPVAWHQLRDTLKPKIVLLLGIHPQQLGISALFHLYAPTRFNECVWIVGPSLQDMEQQPEAKKQLWLNGLKPVFVDTPAT